MSSILMIQCMTSIPAITYQTMSRPISTTALNSIRFAIPRLSRSIATSSSEPPEEPSQDDKTLEKSAQAVQSMPTSTHKPAKSIAEQDAEMMRKLAGISGEGGEAGIEYEDGKPVAMKRGVKNNMFRLI